MKTFTFYICLCFVVPIIDLKQWKPRILYLYLSFEDDFTKEDTHKIFCSTHPNLITQIFYLGRYVNDPEDLREVCSHGCMTLEPCEGTPMVRLWYTRNES